MDDKIKILVVDDEKTLCDVLKLNLELEGYNVDVAYCAEDVLKMDISKYSLMLLDVMMRNISGFELAKSLKSDISTKDIPIIFCTAKDDESDLLQGFENGGDDYIRKPFSMKELLARVKSVLKRYNSSVADIVRYESLVLDLKKKICTIDNSPIELTKKEFEILRLFISNSNKIFSRDEILDYVWGEKVLVIDRTIDVNINRLRKKLGKYGSNIETKLGYGYGFKQ